MKSPMLPQLLQRTLVFRVILAGFLILLIGLGTVPGYLTGYWPWAQPPKVANLKQLKNLREIGLTLPGWKTLNQDVQTIGGHKWSVQTIQRDDQTQALLMLRPPNDHKEQPEVEWMDINGAQQWETDSYRRLSFKGSNPEANVEARFFRAWTQQQTYAVMQWYAWPRGGNPAPSRWFWADQVAQLQRSRMPWVAVSLFIPIEPLGEIETVQSLALSLGQTIQNSLMAESLKLTVPTQ